MAKSSHVLTPIGAVCAIVALCGVVQAAVTDFPECVALASAIGAPVSTMVEIVDEDAPDGYFMGVGGEGRHCDWQLNMAGKELLTPLDFVASMAVLSAEIKRDAQPLRKEDAAVMGFAHEATGSLAGHAWVSYPQRLVESHLLGILGPVLVVDDVSIVVSSFMAPEVQSADQPLNIGWALAASERIYQAYRQ